MAENINENTGDSVSASKSATQPTLFLSHGGGPCFFMDWSLMGEPANTWDKTAAWLKSIASSLPEKPKAIIVISGHWEESEFTVATSPKPSMFYDYYGFPQHTYELQYPAPGSQILAQKIVHLLKQAGITVQTDPRRGFDHGVFIPLLVAFPDADIPVVPISLKSGLDPAEHLAMGKALKSLREEGVLIIGSGMSYHNMGAFRTPYALQPSTLFDTYLTDTVSQDDKDSRFDGLEKWSEGPAARNAHPREEHLIPLMVAAGAGDDDKGECVFSDVVMKAKISAYKFG